MTSHPEFNEKTTATEVADLFADRIKNRNGEFKASLTTKKKCH